MQFKYPELLWALFLLLIPIIVHLFQLRRFKKTPFTNVKFLKKVVSESRRSNILKKWLLLLTRLLLLAAFIIAFARPFFANKSALSQKETVVYLDDSFSMQLNKDGVTLMEEAVQQLIQSIPKDERFSLFTNEKTLKNIVLQDVQNDLLSMPHSNKQLKLNEIYLKAKTLFSSNKATEKNLVAISDFQQTLMDRESDSLQGIRTHIIQLPGDNRKNVAIDSAFLGAEQTEKNNLTVLLSSSENTDDIPVSLFNGNQLTAKTSANFNGGTAAEVNFTLSENEVFKGKIEITDTGLAYDNHLYFNIDKKEKIKVLAIGPLDNTFLKRIYSEDEFIFSSSTLKNLNYGNISSQNLVVLNGLQKIPSTLSTSLKVFTKKGGYLAIIPAEEIDLDSYNLLISNYSSTSYQQSIASEQNITDISFSHPLYRNVFEKSITNFQYPKISYYFPIKSTAPVALSFQNKSPFLIGSTIFFLFSTSLLPEKSNFINSPLIVPTFYNIGVASLKQPELYNHLNQSLTVDIPVTLAKDRILKVTKDDYEFIPRQQSLGSKVSLFFNENPDEDGIYNITEEGESIGSMSFNYDRKESQLDYLDIEQLPATTQGSSIAALFEKMEKDNTVTELWKWFVILALLLLIVEILIQKFFK